MLGGHFFSKVLEFLSDKGQPVRLNGRIRASVDAAWGGCPRVVFSDPCYLYCTLPSSFLLLETILPAKTICAVIPSRFRVLKRWNR